MAIYLLIIWASMGLLFCILISFYQESIIAPLKKYLLIIQKFSDRNKGIIKKDHEYQREAKPPIANFKKLEVPNDQSKLFFYLILYLKFLLFYWIIYLVIYIIGFFLEILDPTLNE